MPPILRLIHPAPALAVTGLSAALALILTVQDGRPPDWRVMLTVVAVAGSQVLTGASNDLADLRRDAGRNDKPLPRGDLGTTSALAVALTGLAVQFAASAPLGAVALGLGLTASASALAYNLFLSRTPASVVPYLVSFGLLPLWIAAGVAVPLDRVLAASLLVLPFAAAAHLANTLRDFDADAAAGSRNLAQLLGRGRSMRLSLALALAVGIGVAMVFSLSERLTPASGVLGAVGLGAVAQGAAGPRRLWAGLLIAAVCWTAAWALATGSG